MGIVLRARDHIYEIDASGVPSPPFCIKFGSGKRAGNLVTADEEGYVTLINTMVKRKEDGSHAYSWMAHRNAIFDVAFSDGDDLLATACGDQTVRVWELSSNHPELKATLRGHEGSVKSLQFRPGSQNELISGARSLQFRPGSQNELISGAREGNIHLWDTRVQTSSAGGLPGCQGNG
ncbi:WD40-repeat-containing domain protein [Baffinella frigidus]|nr:WD40-repeat-containing domain protein [Cryptophyta sp. CCMP2293]